MSFGYIPNSGIADFSFLFCFVLRNLYFVLHKDTLKHSQLHCLRVPFPPHTHLHFIICFSACLMITVKGETDSG